MRGIVEHHLIDLLLREMAPENPYEDEWRAQAGVLRRTVERHIGEEESDLFALARKTRDQAWPAGAYEIEKDRLATVMTAPSARM